MSYNTDIYYINVANNIYLIPLCSFFWIIYVVLLCSSIKLLYFCAGITKHTQSLYIKKSKKKSMKKIEAIIRTSKFQEVKLALREAGIDFFSYTDVTGVGNEVEKAEHSYRGTVYDTSYIPRQLLTIVVRDINMQKTVDAILKAAKTGDIGDGKIFVSDIIESYRIRNDEKGDTSLYNSEK